MIFTVFIFSCESDSFLVPQVSTNTESNKSLQNFSIQDNIDFVDVMDNMHQFTFSNTRPGAEQIADFVNEQMEYMGSDSRLIAAELDQIMSENLFVSGDNSVKSFLKLLAHDGKISKLESKLLHHLDTDIFKADRSDAVRILHDFKSQVENAENLKNDEKLRLSTFADLVSEILAANDELRSRNRGWSECVDCLHKNDIKIGIIAALTVIAAIALCSGAAIASFGLALYPCLAITLGVILAEALIICGRDCFSTPEPMCENPMCPDGFGNNVNNGFQCCTDVVPGLGVTTGGQNGTTLFLTRPASNSGTCPSGWIFNPILFNCVMQITGTWENLTLAGNQACVDAVCQ